MSVALTRPSAVLFDVGDTLLEERRFDLEAGIGAVVPDAADIVALGAAFRGDLARAHECHHELSLASWLRDHVSSLASEPVAVLEDRIWSAIVTLAPRPRMTTVLARLTADGLPLAAVSNAAFSGRVLEAELGRHGLASYFRFVLSSADIGSRKPVPRSSARRSRSWAFRHPPSGSSATRFAAPRRLGYSRFSSARPAGVPMFRSFVTGWNSSPCIHAGAPHRHD